MLVVTYSTQNDKEKAELQGWCMWVLGAVTGVMGYLIWQKNKL